MSGRGGKRRGRPPKATSSASVSASDKKFQYHLLKKPKYLQNKSDSRFSTPSASRASSPTSEESSRKSYSRSSAGRKSRGKATKNKRGSHNTSYASRRSYSSPVYNKTDYHYGSDFGDSDEKSDDDVLESSSSESPENDSDSEFSLSEYSNASFRGQNQPVHRSVTPDLLWLKDDIEIPKLEIPPTSDDLIVPKQYVLRTVGVYEILRRYRNLARLSPFRLEDFCAALMCEEKSALLVEIHIALLKSILREEDSQQTHFGPLDQKDSVNISLYLIDQLTWPEILRSYVESDPSFDQSVLQILSQKEYPYTDIEDRLAVLQLLTDQFLTTTSVRDDMIQEGPIHYDDHCRICHRLGDLLCCETCPAVFHLECVDPPLTNVPTEDWQCSICKSHAVTGVVDCIISQEKQGLLCRQDHLGFDRHGRKYWFVCRRIFVETEDGSDIWYYSVPSQFKNLWAKLDPDDMEKELCKRIEEFKEEILRQMEITETLTNEMKGNKKSYLEIEVEKINKELENNNKVEEETTVTTENGDKNGEEPMDIEESLKANEIDKNAPKLAEEPTEAHLTRSKTNQITNGTYFFKLGMENNFKSYINQFTVNSIALNKPQKNEERDKKRHLSHKFSLTDASQFKWTGTLNGTVANTVSVLKQTLLSFEQAISPPFMHCNWPKLRRTWLNAVAASNTPQDFVKVLISLESCFKGVLFANVWHEQLGHTKLYRITSGEREERKKLEKREKRERDDEEERYRSAYNFVKYSLGLRHQVWKQKGEEYRIHGQWGWLWNSKNRRAKYWNNIYKQRIQCINVVVKHNSTDKILCLKRQTYENLQKVLDLSKNLNTNDDEKYKVLTEIDLQDTKVKNDGIINVSEALKAPVRIIYPKIAKKSLLDDLLERREKLRDEEMKNMDEVKTDEIPETVIPTEHANNKRKLVTNNLNTQCIQRMLLDIIESKNKASRKTMTTEMTEKIQKIHTLRSQLKYTQEILKHHKCYSRNCRNNTMPINLQSFTSCYSNLCLKEMKIKKEIAQLIQNMKEKSNLFKKSSILHQKLTENKQNDLLELLQKYQLWDYVNDEYYQYDLNTCLSDLTSALEEAQEFKEELFEGLISDCKPEEEIKKEDCKTEETTEEEKPEKKEFSPSRSNRRFPVLPKAAVKKEVEKVEKDVDVNGKEKIYSSEYTRGKVYLKKSLVNVKQLPETNGTSANSTGQEVNKFPVISNFHTIKGTKNIMVLPKYELVKMARRAGKLWVNGFNHQAKNNTSVWPYPCPRPLFKTCWIYRTFSLNSFACLALQLRIIWTCLRWDDMQTKPPTTDGKNQVTTETEILTTELLKHRFAGMFMERTQYLRRKIVIPLELPKTVREVNPIRSGLRKRKRAESPVQTDPQVTEEWVDEDKLELWEIKQYGERQERVHLLPITRQTTGKLPPPKSFDEPAQKTTIISSKQTPEQIKEKMEEQLRIQRAIRNQRRADELNNKHVISPGTPTQAVKTITKRIIVKHADGTQKIIHQQITTPITSSEASASNQEPIMVTPQKPEPQKVQIIRGPDGKVSVRGLNPGQQLMQTPDGKLHVISSPQSQASPYKTMAVPRIIAKPATATVQATSPITANVAAGSKILIRQQLPKAQIVTATTNSPKILNNDESKQAETSVSATVTTPVQKIITSTGQIITQIPAQASNLQQLLQRGNLTGQKIILNQGAGVQKLLVTSPGQQIIGDKQIIIQNTGGQTPQRIIMNQHGQIIPSVTGQQQIIIGNQKILLSPDQRIVQQSPQVKTVQPQQIQVKIQQQQQQQQAPVAVAEQPKPTQQIVVQNSSIAQQLAEGKIQLANFNGQQVLIRQIGNGQAQIVGHVKTNVPTQQVVTQTVTQQQIQTQNIQQQQQLEQQQQQQQQQIQTQIVTQQKEEQLPTSIEQSLLAGQPPGTIIKCVTAQVVQTNNGPRIVLQGLQGSDFTQQQTQLVQQQVKQQLLKAQESNGKQGVLGPTKIYLAIQPAPQQQQTQQISSQPPPLTILQQPQDECNDEQRDFEQDDIIQEDKGDDNMGDSFEGGFVLTPAYIQDTIKTVLKQGNLNPEIEEKLLNLQRYQEKQMKGETFDASNYTSTSQTSRNLTSPDEFEDEDDSRTSSTKGRKRRDALDDDDDDWVLDTPKKRVPKNEKQMDKERKRDYMSEFKKTISNDRIEQSQSQVPQVIVKTETPVNQIKKNIIVKSSGAFVVSTNESSNVNINNTVSDVKQERMNIVKREIRLKATAKEMNDSKVVSSPDDSMKHTKLQNQLNKYKENLKKSILKKRDVLEKQLQNEIQKELSQELASHIKSVYQKQEKTKKENKVQKRTKTESQSSVTAPINSSPEVERPKERHVGRPRKSANNNSTSSINEPKGAGKKKNQKIYCVCRKPYDRTKFYIGCDLCNNWFHGECVGVSEDQSKNMTEFVCTDCKKANENKELFCLCKTPYDATLFYICCDKCQDWFHGKCVGILQSEADYIDEYICPNCQKDSSPSNVNNKQLREQDYQELRIFLKDIQCHKSAWPFIDPVDASEAPDYYKVIKEPMDLKQIENNVLSHSYICLADFIKDMVLIFDNCRYYNSKESSFYKCAESLENYFTQKLNGFREHMAKNENV